MGSAWGRCASIDASCPSFLQSACLLPLLTGAAPSSLPPPSSPRAAEEAGVRVGDVILQVDGIDVQPTRDVRDLLVNQNSEVRLLLQADSTLASGSAWAFVGLSSLRSGGPVRNVVIRRRTSNARGSQGGGMGSPAAAQRSPNVDETPLPPAAQAAREKGRTLFRESRWLEAATAFSEAIDKCTSSHTLYTNRALCHQKLERWREVEDDARAAMACPSGGSSSVKAHYLLGRSLLEQGKLEEAKEALLKSMSLSSSPDFKSYRGSIEAGLSMARKRIWERAQEGKDAADEELREELLQVAEACCSERDGGDGGDEVMAGEDEGGGAGGRTAAIDGEIAKQLMEARINAISRLLSRGRVKRSVAAIPSAIMCKLTHRIMLDPVTTPYGRTYEKEAIEKYLKEARGDREHDAMCPDPFKVVVMTRSLSCALRLSLLPLSLSLARALSPSLSPHQP